MSDVRPDTVYHLDGSVREQRWLDGNRLHRENGPARALWNIDGKLTIEEWYIEDQLHRIDGPAEIQYRPDGTVRSESWYHDGNRHRVDGLAKTIYHPDGSPQVEEWYRDGWSLMHRIDGTQYGYYFQHWQIPTAPKQEAALLAAGADRVDIGYWRQWDQATALELLGLGATAAQVQEAESLGLTTYEGLMQVFRDGVPLEWARSWQT